MMILKNPSHTVVTPSTGFPTPSIVDTFTRANALNLGANYGRWWSLDTNLGISSNQAYPQTADYCDNYYNVAQYQNVDIAVTITTLPPTNEIVYLGGRIQSPGTSSMDCYQLVYTVLAGTDTIRLDRVVNESETALQTWNQNLANGNGLGMRISGTGATVTIEIYVNTGSGWTSIGSFNDTNAARITATGYGALGIGSNNTSARIDDFIVGNS